MLPSWLAPAKPVPLRRNGDFMLLWSGQVVSTVRTRVSSLAYALLALGLTHSPAKAGLVGFGQTLPFLLFYPAGGSARRPLEPEADHVGRGCGEGLHPRQHRARAEGRASRRQAPTCTENIS